MLRSGKERTQFAKHTAVAMMLAGWDGAGEIIKNRHLIVFLMKNAYLCTR